MHPKYSNGNPVLLDDIVKYMPENELARVTSLGYTPIGLIITMDSKYTRKTYTTEDTTEISPATPEEIKLYKTNMRYDDEFKKAFAEITSRGWALIKVKHPINWFYGYTKLQQIEPDHYFTIDMSITKQDNPDTWDPKEAIDKVPFWQIVTSQPVKTNFAKNYTSLRWDNIEVITEETDVNHDAKDAILASLKQGSADIVISAIKSEEERTLEEIVELIHDYDIEYYDYERMIKFLMVLLESKVDKECLEYWERQTNVSVPRLTSWMRNTTLGVHNDNRV